MSIIPTVAAVYDRRRSRNETLATPSFGVHGRSSGAQQEVKTFIDSLCDHGLTFLGQGKAIDIAVVDQHCGLTTPCEWLEVSKLHLREEGGEVSACWLFEGPRIASGLYMQLLYPLSARRML